uniref:Putative ovule protein n=1 Tax=Solanum chacoense TaxID=4108 RepID=A0A0V0I005_SOLCH
MGVVSRVLYDTLTLTTSDSHLFEPITSYIILILDFTIPGLHDNCLLMLLHLEDTQQLDRWLLSV